MYLTLYILYLKFMLSCLNFSAHPCQKFLHQMFKYHFPLPNCPLPHLITLHPPDIDDLGHSLDQIKPLCPEEQRAAIRPVVSLDAQTGRARLGEEDALITDGPERLLEELEMVYLLFNRAGQKCGEYRQ